MRPDLPRGTVTFLFTDIEGSTRLLHALGPEAYGEALAEHRRALREAFAAHGGVEIDTQGDAFFVAFATAPGAAAAARAGTEALAAGAIRVRMGLHTGAPTLAAEGYVGVDVHRGARIGALAHGGQIVVSPTTAALLGDEPLLDLGPHRLKDFDSAIRLHQLGHATFPPLRTPGAVELPNPATRFLGRERELFDAVSLVLERDPRVLTIVGPGGTGKTRFSIELARLLADEAEGATLFVPFAPIHDASLLLPTIAERLGATERTAQAIGGAVGVRRTHLVLDNLEHLLPNAAAPLSEVVAEAPALRLLVTSREPLRIQGETELDLPPLAEHEAVSLFLERARAVRHGAIDITTAGELCRRLDCLPLAVELAAARTKLLSPQALLERLGQRLDLLKGTRDADKRHATLRATIAWSYDLLDEPEQRLFRALSVFRGGCTLESAEAVCDADLDTLASLLDKSLIRRRIGRLGEERFWMLETIREFATEQLGESGEADAVRRAHAERMLAIARAASLDENDDEPFDWSAALAEREDLRAAMDWAAETDVVFGLELGSELEAFWGPHAPREGIQRFTDLLSRDVDVPPYLRAVALRNLGGAAHQERDWDVTVPAYEESLRIFTELDDRRGMASVRTRLAYCAATAGDTERALRLLEESQRDAHGRFALIEQQNAMLQAHMAMAEGRLDDAEAALDRSKELGVRWSWYDAILYTVAAELHLRRGNLVEAERHAQAALSINLGDEHAAPTTMITVATIARIALERGDLERAGLLWGALSRLDFGRFVGSGRRLAEALVAERRQEFLDAAELGRALDLGDAAELARLDDPQTVP